MLKEILVVSGRPGLYKLVSKGNNLLIIESLIDKKRTPAYAREKIISLGDISVYTDSEEVSVGEILTAIKEKENGGSVSIDLSNAQPDDLRAYFADILPNFDRERVYPSDIKKVLKWYGLLMANDITDFSKKEKDETTGEEVKEDDGAADENTDARKTPKVKTAPAKTAKRNTAPKTITATKTSTAKSTPKTSTPKKNVVGAKRGG
jgi:hypothetical protein